MNDFKKNQYSNSVPNIQILNEKLDTNRINNDVCFIQDADIEGNFILITVSYSGGCKNHLFDLYANQFESLGNSNHQTNLILKHNSNNDHCKKIIEERLCFDLYPLKKKCQQDFKLKKGSILLHIRNISLNYDFNEC